MTKKIIISLISIALLASTGTVFAWDHGWHHGGPVIIPPHRAPVFVCPPRYHRGVSFGFGLVIDPTIVIGDSLPPPPPTTVVVVAPAPPPVIVESAPAPVTQIIHDETVVTWVENDNGSKTEVRLTKTSSGAYIGPQGEYYSSMPSQEQLEKMYAVKSKPANITVWITNDNGSQTPITLTPCGTGFVGPSNEYYQTMPTEDQLKAMYGMRSNAPAQNSVIIWLESSTGPDIPVVLTKEGSDYVGPKGEHYSSIPTKEQLKMIYGEKPKKVDNSNTVVVWINNNDGSKTPITLQKDGSNYVGPAGEKYTMLPTEQELKLLYGTDSSQQGELSFQITKDDGSKTVVVLKKDGNEFVGPKGERYGKIPTEDQLKLIYGK